MTYYREIRTITGRKILTKESPEERFNRILFGIEIVMTPIVVILAFALAGGMI